MNQLKQLGLSISEVLNLLLIRIIGLVILVGPSVVKMNSTGKLGQNWLKVFILNRWQLAKIHCGGCGKIEVAALGFDLEPVIVWGYTQLVDHGRKELATLQICFI